MKKSYSAFICIVLGVVIFTGCSSGNAVSSNGNVKNKSETTVSNSEKSENNADKYELSFVKTDFKTINPYISDGVFTVIFDDKTYNFSDMNGKLISKKNYSNVIAGFSEGYAFVVDKDKKGYYIDTKGKTVIDNVNGEKIELGDIFTKGVANVSLKSKKQVSIDKKGKICPPVEKDYKDYKFAGNYYTDNEKFGLFDEKSNKPLTNLIYKNVTRFVDNKALVTDMDDNLLLIYVKGDVIANLSKKFANVDSEEINDISNQCFAVNFKDNTGSKILDLSGNVIAQTNYSYIGKFDDGFAMCKIGDKYGCTDKDGNEVIPVKYDNVSNIYAADNTHYALVKEGNVWSICKIENKVK